ncbi:RNA-binding protein [Deinococcus sp. KNUC1210]|uniref:Jag family protein n=1 Tax=Deinococcus sp. KNUC1210 TaxID=2917691 RepID=UPI001EEF94D2|nr:R3H domain-containing nucleic acid-binding protein [Deinococcus sp. KNUC1210]ULH16546.1 RNA-binding protein [Deinococcus sp. KNUC1210]
MDNPKNLDDYLAGLGISEADESAPPAPPAPLSEATGTALHELPTALDARETLTEFLQGLLSRIDPELSLTVSATDNALEAEIQGERAAKMAGRDGRILGAIEVLAYAALSRQGYNDIRVRVDAGGFRRRYNENLSRMAERLAVQVAKTGESHEMQPMPPADRRVIHLALQEHALVQTESVGEGQNRRLIIRPRPHDSGPTDESRPSGSQDGS